MTIRRGALLASLLPLVLGAPAALAEPMPLPLDPVVSPVASASGPGFASDVETALDDLTRLQCGLLGLMLINSQPCPVK